MLLAFINNLLVNIFCCCEFQRCTELSRSVFWISQLWTESHFINDQGDLVITNSIDEQQQDLHKNPLVCLQSVSVQCPPLPGHWCGPRPSVRPWPALMTTGDWTLVWAGCNDGKWSNYCHENWSALQPNTALNSNLMPSHNQENWNITNKQKEIRSAAHCQRGFNW